MDTPMEEMTLKQLQQEIVKLGMPEDDALKFNTKTPLIATINTLRATKAVQKVSSLEEQVDKKEEKKVESNWKNKAQKQYDYWASQPQVRILVPLEGKETQGVVREEWSEKEQRNIQIHVSGAIQPVTENGAKFLIPKGQYVTVPEPVAKIIQDKYQQTSEAGRDLLIDRIDPETGRSVRDQL